MRDFRYRTNVVFDETIVTTLQGADVEHHVELARAIENRAACFVGFDVGQRGAEWKTDHSANRNAAAAQVARGDAHPRGIDAHRREPVSRGFLAKLFDVVVSGFGLQECVVYQTRPLARGSRLAQHETDTRGARVHDAVHPLGAAMKTL